MKHDKIIPDLAAVRARARRAKKAPGPVRITKARRPPPDDSRTLAAAQDFVPASPRERHDGWTPGKQVAFIDALGECGCVTTCERVGLSPSTAYRLRRRVDAYSFRAAWDAALDHAIRRLSDAAFSRALHGVAQPLWFQGEQVGERLYYDERLTMFLLRYRDPDTYGAWRDRRAPRRPVPISHHAGQKPLSCNVRICSTLSDAAAASARFRRPCHRIAPTHRQEAELS